MYFKSLFNGIVKLRIYREWKRDAINNRCLFLKWFALLLVHMAGEDIVFIINYIANF